MATAELLEPNMLLSPRVWASLGHRLNPLRRPLKARVMTEPCTLPTKIRSTNEYKTSSQILEAETRSQTNSRGNASTLIFLTRQRSPRSQPCHNLQSPFSSESPRRAGSLWEVNHALQTEIGAWSRRRSTVSTDEQPFRKPLGRSKHPDKQVHGSF